MPPLRQQAPICLWSNGDTTLYHRGGAPFKGVPMLWIFEKYMFGLENEHWQLKQIGKYVNAAGLVRLTVEDLAGGVKQVMMEKIFEDENALSQWMNEIVDSMDMVVPDAKMCIASTIQKFIDEQGKEKQVVFS
jgi:hypothetical protein